MTNIVLMTVNFCMAIIGISLLLLLYRALKGPTEADKAVALDAIGTCIIAFCGLLAIKLSSTALNDVILLVGILSFIGTVATAKFLEKGKLIEK
ncbi:monovalent cation/H+ antiporter complex subunit F [Bacillus sp. Cs-700]|uniref:monovalent cation/H+ antiporter complex subunit F n=1 Tax=Bacillus sp. Cs-700 TaxID=2589818 RepID=UPI001F60549E|nr:monovalent cation/H+ antiporter complex subunit F [Bacillus sp. Cs-700]